MECNIGVWCQTVGIEHYRNRFGQRQSRFKSTTAILALDRVGNDCSRNSKLSIWRRQDESRWFAPCRLNREVHLVIFVDRITILLIRARLVRHQESLRVDVYIAWHQLWRRPYLPNGQHVFLFLGSSNDIRPVDRNVTLLPIVFADFREHNVKSSRVLFIGPSFIESHLSAERSHRTLWEFIHGVLGKTGNKR